MRTPFLLDRFPRIDVITLQDDETAELTLDGRGEPRRRPVYTPRDAVECFWTSPLDALVIGSFVLEKPAGRPSTQTGS
jgi:hypothetical protein